MIRLHFYKGPGRIGDKLIRWWTGSIYSHVELEIDGVCYSADMWSDTVRGAGFNPNPDKWDSINIPATPEQQAAALAFIRRQLGRRYDWAGIIFSQFIALARHHDDKWFCSELCHAALVIAGLLPAAPSHEVDPGELYAVAQRGRV